MTSHDVAAVIVSEQIVGMDTFGTSTKLTIDPVALTRWIISVEDRLRELNPGRES